MLAFAKYRLPDQFLYFFTQCHRHPKCIYATSTASHLKHSENSNLMPIGYKVCTRHVYNICRRLEITGRLAKTAPPNDDRHYHHHSVNSITEFNFDTVDKIPHMTNHCKLVVQRLNSAIQELSEQACESGVDYYKSTPTSLKPLKSATSFIIESLETNHQPSCIYSHCLPDRSDMLFSASGSCLLISSDDRVHSAPTQEMESVICDYSVWPWSNNHLCDNSNYNSEMAKGSCDGLKPFQFTPADNVAIDTGQLFYSPPVGCTHSINSHYSSSSALKVQNDIGLAMLCQFIDRNDLQFSELYARQFVFKRTSMLSSKTQGAPPEEKNLPSADQLRVIQDYMPENMPRLFLNNHDYSVYTDDLLFENSWYSGNSYTTVGRLMYTLEVAKLRLFVHVRLANIRIHLLKTTAHTENGTVKVRWRVSGIPQTRAFMFWNFLPWNKNRHSNSVDPEWLDGISTFSVNRHGKIFKHKMDRVISNEDRDLNVKPSVIDKLAGLAAPATS